MPKINRIAITLGEPAGIGPECGLSVGLHDYPAELVFITDPLLLEKAANVLGKKIKIRDFKKNSPARPHKAGIFTVIPIALTGHHQWGRLNIDNASYVLETLETASRGALAGDWQGIVTGPVHKSVLHLENQPFTGHTEFFAEKASCPVVMMLYTPTLKVALATTHLPLAEVPKAITKPHLTEVISTLYQSLCQQFHLEAPKIAIAGLNPHAGEQGALGHEEQQVIIPVIQQLKKNGWDLTGPLPADTLFRPNFVKNFDAVLAMYHDQGLPVLKALGFQQAVNITLGLPYIRTSVDHGTALELAGTGSANANSFKTAVKEAIQRFNDGTRPFFPQKTAPSQICDKTL